MGITPLLDQEPVVVAPVDIHNLVMDERRVVVVEQVDQIKVTEAGMAAITEVTPLTNTAMEQVRTIVDHPRISPALFPQLQREKLPRTQ